MVVRTKELNKMGISPVDRVRQRRKELGDELAKLQEERDRLDAYLVVHEEPT